jgi:hypothetical protein
MKPAPSPRRTLTVFLLLAVLSTVFLDYWSYSRSFHAEPDIWASTLRGTTAAPEQYRIGVLKTAEFLTLHTPLAMRHALALIDLVALLVAVFVLQSLLTRSTAWRSASLAAQWFGAAAFVALLEYSLLWLTWYQRPETLTIAALLALSLWFCTNRVRFPGVEAGNVALCILGILLGFVRADVAITFNLGIAIICLTRLGKGFPSGRWRQLFASLVTVICAAAMQLHIMHDLYPHATYGTTPVFQLLLNYTDHIRIVPFALFMVPTVWVVLQILRHRFSPQPAQAGLLLGAAIFVVLWCVLGKIDEVRIFLPFSFALAPLTIEAAMARIAVAEDIPTPL